jgi:membrane protein implicated in regulation of membrane protease activity
MIPGDQGIPPRRYRTPGPSLWPVLAGVVVAALFAVPYGAIAVLALLLIAVSSFALLWAGYRQGFQDGYRQHQTDQDANP